MNTGSIFTLLLATTLLGGCSFQNKLTSALSPTAPSASSGSSESSAPSSSSSSGGSASIPTATGLDGTWASNTIPGLPTIANCTNLNWSISSQSASSIAGNISAVCGGIATVTATLTGELVDNDSKVDLTAKGQVVGLGLTCGFDLTGSGKRETIDSVRLNYQGSTCLGTVSGSELLRRKSQAPAPAPASASAPPEPEPPPVNDPLFGCGGIQDNYQMVECIHSHIRPWDEYSSFEVTKRVAWGLRDRGGAGLLIKPNGENIVSWRGYTFAAARICYPDGHIYKVLTDVGRGGANGPSWQDEGLVDRNRYLPALDPTLP